jgi:hypothetical protein
MAQAKKTKKKPNALAAAASRRLASVGEKKPLSDFDIAHRMFHAEEHGEVQRVPMEDGTWAWELPSDSDGQRRLLRPTPAMLDALEQFAAGHGHDHD